MARPDTPSTGESVAGGLLAGMIAGIVMALAAMIYMAAATPMEFWLPMKNIAATWLGVSALIGGASAVAVGVITHLVVASGWGLLFGLVAGRQRSVGGALVAGIVYGTVVWAIMTWLIMPWINPTMSARVEVLPGWWWWTLHAIFGVVLASTPFFARRAVAGERPEARPGTPEAAAA